MNINENVVEAISPPIMLIAMGLHISLPDNQVETMGNAPTMVFNDVDKIGLSLVLPVSIRAAWRSIPRSRF